MEDVDSATAVELRQPFGARLDLWFRAVVLPLAFVCLFARTRLFLFLQTPHADRVPRGALAVEVP